MREQEVSKMKKTLIIAMVLMLFMVGVLFASDESYVPAIPHQLNYQGMLTQSDGVTPVADGAYSIRFSIWDDATLGSELWNETQSVQVSKGLFNVNLGSVTPLGLAFDKYYWLEIKVGADPKLSPRTKLTSVGYAYMAEQAITALSSPTGGGWVDAGATVRLQTATDNVGIGTTSPNAKLEINGNNSEEGLRVAWGSTYPTLYGEFKHSGSGGLKINANAGGGWADMSLQTDGTTRMFIESGGNIGIGTTSPNAKLEINGNNSQEGLRVAWGSTYPALYGEFKHSGSGGLKINANAGGGWADMSLQTDGTTRMFIESGGNVGIGTTTPGAKLEVSGDLKVTGAYTGAFPRPAYNSGWITINPSTHRVIIHNVGGNVDDYVVDLQFKDVDGVWGTNNIGMGSDKWAAGVSGDFPNGFWSFGYHYSGACWTNLTSTSIMVVRQAYDTEADQIRVRIWVVK
jgi:hypothetical protein